MSFNWGRHWGVILAGGDGERLRPLTRLIAGDDRPKQFCPLLEGEKTLLEQTQLRVAKAVQPSQTLYVLTQQHERFYAGDLAQVAAPRLIVQNPQSRDLACHPFQLGPLDPTQRRRVRQPGRGGILSIGSFLLPGAKVHQGSAVGIQSCGGESGLRDFAGGGCDDSGHQLRLY